MKNSILALTALAVIALSGPLYAANIDKSRLSNLIQNGLENQTTLNQDLHDLMKDASKENKESKEVVEFYEMELDWNDGGSEYVDNRDPDSIN